MSIKMFSSKLKITFQLRLKIKLQHLLHHLKLKSLLKEMTMLIIFVIKSVAGILNQSVVMMAMIIIITV